jgi:protease-4
MIKTINKIHKDEDVKAVVLRVNSPGGSANASEQIWHAVSTLKEKGLPVVVSMGDYAASGGYYISCHADYIYAEPTTLTGSIGIFGMIPSFDGLRDKIGIDVDTVSTNMHSSLSANAVYMGMNSKERALMQTMVERGYDLFTKRCAEGRGLSQDSIKAIGEGRVWLGKDALELGLVDAMGNMNDAIKKAASLAKLGEYELVYYPQEEDLQTIIQDVLSVSTTEEQLLKKLRDFVSQPRVMTLMPKVIIK